jgi:hypothetical protein
MSVIAELTVPAEGFELGRILAVEGAARLALETMVPLGERPVPFVRLHEDARESFEAAVREHPAVTDLVLVDSHEGETLYALGWDIAENSFFESIQTAGATLLLATGAADTWHFELRFASHDVLSAFREECSEAGVPLDITRVYNPTKPDAGPWYGLTPQQHEALTLAVRRGYYAIPRGASTQDLADELDISDQALTERLRRAIVALTTNTLLVPDSET